MSFCQLLVGMLVLQVVHSMPAINGRKSSDRSGGYETMDIVPVSKHRRSAVSSSGSRIAITAAGAHNRQLNDAELLELKFPRHTVTLEIDASGNVLAQARFSPISGNALDLKMVLDPTTREPLRLPIDSKKSPPLNEYKYLIRGHYNQLYICMNTNAKVYTVAKEGNKLPEDCLWRGLLIPRDLPNSSQKYSRVSFYHAFYPENPERGGGSGSGSVRDWVLSRRSRRRKWFLGFRKNVRQPALGYDLRAGTRRVEFLVKLYPGETTHRVESQFRVQIGSQEVHVANSTLGQAVHEHVQRHYGGPACEAAATTLRQHAESRSRKARTALHQLRQLRRALRNRSSRAGVPEAEAARGERALRGYLRDLTYHSLYNRGRCVREELVLAFQSASVADLLLTGDGRRISVCQRARRPALRRRHQRAFRRHQRQLKTFFFDQLRVGGARNRSVLCLFREELGISLPGMRQIQEARLRRKVTKQLRRKMERSEYSEYMRSELRVESEHRRSLLPDILKVDIYKAQVEDSARFILTVLHRRTARLFSRMEEASPRTGGAARRKKQPLVTKQQYDDLRAMFSSFPVFYFDMRCGRGDGGGGGSYT